MTTLRMLNIRILDSAVRSIAVFTVLIASLASAQQAGTAQRSEQTAAGSVSAQVSTPAQTVFRPRMPGVGLQSRKAASAAPGGANLLFLPPITYESGGDNPFSVAVADLNVDGKPDLVVGNQCTGPDYCDSPGLVSVLLGIGDGTFQPAVNYASGGSVLNSVAVADLNGDGKPDIIAVNACSTSDFNDCPEASIGILLGNGAGTFQSVVTYASGGYHPNEVVVADLNGDDKIDLLVVNQCASPCDNIFPPESSVAVLLGKGDGTFQKAVTYASGGYFSFSLALADLNGDGRPDVVVSNFCDSNVNLGSCDDPAPVGVLLGNGDGTLQPAVLYGSGGKDARAVAIADVNGDGKPDLLVANCGSDGCGGGDQQGAVAVLFGRGDGTFQSAVTIGVGGYFSVSAADMDGDGKLDIVAANDGSPQTFCADLFRGNGDGTFQSAEAYDCSGLFLDSLSVADLNGDGKLDIVATHGFGNGLNLPPGSVDVLLNSTGPLNPSTTLLASSLNPSAYGQAATFTAHVTANTGTPTGTVLLLNGSATVGSGTLTNGTASIVVSSLPVGANSITAKYQGSTTFAPSTSTPLTQTVHIATTTTSLLSSLSPAGTHQSVAFTATVTSQFGGAATGSVVFFSGSQTLGTASLTGNHATLTRSFSATGTYSISAKYNGDGNNAASTSSTLSQVILAATATALISSLNPSVVGQAVTFTATVSSSAGAPPNGELITFKNGSTVLGTAALSGGIAALTTSSLSAGIYTITASYNGDANFTASTSSGLRQVVNSTTKSATSTTLSSSLNPSLYGQSVTFKATVTTTGSIAPTGTVNFTWSGYSIGAATLNSSGIAILTKSNLNVYTYPLVASYSGDANNLASTSVVLNQVVKQTTSTATLTSSPNPSTQSQAVTFTAKITSATVVPTGPVTFKAGNAVLGTAQLSAGKATFTTSTLPVGATIVTATYPWNSNIASSSALVTQTVGQ